MRYKCQCPLEMNTAVLFLLSVGAIVAAVVAAAVVTAVAVAIFAAIFTIEFGLFLLPVFFLFS